MNLRIISAIARKDIIDAIRNSYVLFSIAFPVGFWFLFTFLLASGDGISLGALAVYDPGHSMVVEQLRADPTVEKIIETNSLEQLRETVKNEAVGGVALPVGFDSAVVQGLSPEYTVIKNGKRGGGEQAVFLQLVETKVKELVKNPVPAQMNVSDANDSPDGTESNGFDTQSFFLVLLLVMGLAMTGSFVVPTLLVEEKEKHTLKNILVSPASYVDVVAGKALVGLFYAVLGAAVLLVLNRGLGANGPMMVVAVLVGGLLMVEVGLLLGALCKTTTQVNTWSSIVMIVLISPTFMTGIWASGAVDAVMRFIPTYYLGDMVMMAHRGDPWGSAVLDVSVMVGVVVVIFVAIAWVLRRQER